MSADDARRLFEDARAAAAERDTARSIALAREAIAADPEFPEALEHLAMLLVTRQRKFDQGLDFVDRAVAARPDDPGLWYSAGWLYEFAAHDRRRAGDATAARPLYERATEHFRRCLALNPEGKLQGDAEDLLDHIENELQSL